MKTWLFVCALVLALYGVAQGAEMPKVRMETSYGSFVIELDPEKAPKTVSNFLHYVKTGYYDNTIFHRVIPGFVIQGGGLTANMREKPNDKKPIKNEANNGLTNKRYSLSMARTSDPHSATSQFFINLADNRSLNFRSTKDAEYGYAVFGRVVEGMDVVDRIAAVPTKRSGMHDDVPSESITILRVTPVQ